MTTKQNERLRKSGYVRWDELSDEAKRELLTTGHPTNRPKEKDQKSGDSIFRPDGKGWCIGFAF